MAGGVTGTSSCPTCGAAVQVRYGSWRCTAIGGCGTRGTTLPDGRGGQRLAVTAAPGSLRGVQGRYRQQLMDTSTAVRTL